MKAVAAGAGELRSTRAGSLGTATRVLAGVIGVGYFAAGLAGAVLGNTGSGSDLAIWLLLLVGGGALVLAGSLGTRPGPLAVAVTAVGAAAGALALFWSVLAPVLAIALVALSVVRARRARA